MRKLIILYKFCVPGTVAYVVSLQKVTTPMLETFSQAKFLLKGETPKKPTFP